LSLIELAGGFDIYQRGKRTTLADRAGAPENRLNFKVLKRADLKTPIR
jgi:hypothetical protein